MAAPDQAGPVGFVGLGRMGGPMAGRLAAGGEALVVYDRAGTAERAPEGAAIAGSVGELAGRAGTVFLCLPDGAAVAEVAGEIVAAAPCATRAVVDLSTIGIAAAHQVQAILGGAGIDYLDAPVSGGVAGARAGTLAVMAAGGRALFARLEPLLGHMAGNSFLVGESVGQGQAMKLANNFLSATALAATSEAVVFGQAAGLEPETMIAVLNVSTGRNTATSDKFPRRVMTGTYDTGFSSSLMTKDVRLYLEGVRGAGTRGELARALVETWNAMERAMPGADATCIYRFCGGRP